MNLAQAAPDALADAPLWAQAVYAIVTVLIAGFLLPWLKSMAEQARSKANEQNQAAAITLRERIKAAAIEGAGVIAEQRLPALAERILAREQKYTKAEIKNEMRQWGADLKQQLVREFSDSDGINLIEVVGDAALDNIVRWAADSTSPFPGKETATTLLIDDWSNRLVKFGVSWVAQKWLAQDEPTT